MAIKKSILFFLLLGLFHVQCKSQKIGLTYDSESLKITPISENIFIHKSYLETNEYGKVACNGLIYINANEAVVFDTPINNEVSLELLNWLKDEKKALVKAIVINHFHIDCLGGLETFHDAKIPSYAHKKTLEMAKKDNVTIPQFGFEKQNELTIGHEKVINTFFGEAHTKDNIVHYIPNEELIFGGCMIKSLGASKGNLEDANLTEWSLTVQRIKYAHPNVKTVVPGHGIHGNIDLLDYTIELFKQN